MPPFLRLHMKYFSGRKYGLYWLHPHKLKSQEKSQIFLFKFICSTSTGVKYCLKIGMMIDVSGTWYRWQYIHCFFLSFLDDLKLEFSLLRILASTHLVVMGTCIHSDVELASLRDEEFLLGGSKLVDDPSLNLKEM